jgi:hypothetical protein
MTFPATTIVNGVPTTSIADLVQTFFAPVDFSRLDIEERKVGCSDYQTGLAGLRDRGFDRYLTLREHFAIRSYAGSDEKILAVQDNLQRRVGEWLHASLRASPGMVSIAPGFPRYARGVVPVSLSFEMMRSLNDGWNDISVFPSEFRSILSDFPLEQMKRLEGLYLYQDDVWRPVARGYNYGGVNFSLIAYGYRGASRGVRRKDA